MPDLPALPRRRWSAAAHEGIRALVAERVGQRSVAALDWDETCICGDISYALLDDLDRQTDQDLWAHYGQQIQEDRLVAYKELAVTLLRGKTADEAQVWTRDVYQRGVDASTIQIVPEMADLVAHLHAADWEVWVVTGSPTAVVAAIAPHIGIASDRVIGMDPVVEDGRFGNHLIEPVTWREGKATLVKERTGQSPTLAVGDSEGDIRLLESAHRAIWVDRGDVELRTAAAGRDWWRQEGWR